MCVCIYIYRYRYPYRERLTVEAWSISGLPVRRVNPMYPNPYLRLCYLLARPYGKQRLRTKRVNPSRVNPGVNLRLRVHPNPDPNCNCF